ncbi:MAG: bacterial Ig-like domain-containing protein [Clostridia bacterium]|nr:bacterial Ig-like domain-containing protein [Clostridia bacterium]
MTKKIITFVTLLLCALLALTGCAGDQYNKISISGAQDTGYIVTGNGGSAVTYGNYVYFLNGTRGYADSDGTNNVFGEVVKGGVYRAELLGSKVEGADYDTFAIERDAETLLTLKSHKETNYKRDEVDVVDVQLIAPKTVGTSGYSQGGIYILGNNMYYASPNNLKNKSGVVQDNKTDFFRMTLDGATTQKLYTTTSDSASSPYTFMEKGGYVYVVVLDGTDLISVKTNKATGKVEDTIKIAENVTSAVLPTKPVYYDGISENTIYDFIYFERQADENDRTQTGEVLEFVRPDGSARYVFAADGSSDYTLEGVRDGYLFYRKPVRYSDDRLYATNLHDALKDNDAAYAADAINANTTNVDKEILTVEGLDGLKVHAFVSGYEFGKSYASNAINVLTYTSTTDSSASVVVNHYVDGDFRGKVAESAGLAIVGVHNDTVYTNVSGTLSAVSFKAGANYEKKEIAQNTNAGTYGVDVAGGHLVYFGSVGDANDYTLFHELDGIEGADDIFVGALKADDVPTKIEKITIEQNPNKTSYKIGESIDLSGLEVSATYYKDSEGNRPDDELISVSNSMISGFDSSKAGDVTVTVTYEKRSATFTVTIENATADSCADATGWVIAIVVIVLLAGAGAFWYYKKRAKRS